MVKASLQKKERGYESTIFQIMNFGKSKQLLDFTFQFT